MTTADYIPLNFVVYEETARKAVRKAMAPPWGVNYTEGRRDLTELVFQLAAGFAAPPCTLTVTVASPHESATVFLAGIYDLARRSKDKQGSIAIMRHMDSLLHSGRFSECDDILAAVDVAQLPVRMVLSFVTITNNIPSDNLKNVLQYKDAAKARLAAELGEERAAKLVGD